MRGRFIVLQMGQVRAAPPLSLWPSLYASTRVEHVSVWRRKKKKKKQRGRNLPIHVLKIFQTRVLAVTLTINFQITIHLPSKMGDLGVYSWEDYFKKKWLLYWATMHLRGGFNGFMHLDLAIHSFTKVYKTLVLQVLNHPTSVNFFLTKKTTLSDMASKTGQSVVRIGA